MRKNKATSFDTFEVPDKVFQNEVKGCHFLNTFWKANSNKKHVFYLITNPNHENSTIHELKTFNSI